VSQPRIDFSPYELKASRVVSPLSFHKKQESSVRRGALLRVEFQNGFGYADLHPWEELGDESLERQLKGLASGQPCRLGQIALGFASLDAEARAEGRSLFSRFIPRENSQSRIEFPENHRLLGALLGDGQNDLREESLRSIWEQGFRALKIKLSRDWRSELLVLQESVPGLAPFHLRLDFNGQLSPEEFFHFCEALPAQLLAVIEFVEDPIPFDVEKWNQLGDSLPLALDRLPHPDIQSTDRLQKQISELRASWLIWKSAATSQKLVQAWIGERESNAKVCVTSYLDHPLGQMAALYSALDLLAQSKNEAFQLGRCGLASHLVYEKSDFSESLVMKGSRLLPTSGTGFGFDELLAKQNWKSLSKGEL
jgi:o-succinylbenzoate synthase